MNKKWFFLFVLFIVVLFGAGVYLLITDTTRVNLPPSNFPSSTPTLTQPFASQSAELAIVKRVIDGDTIELSDGRRVRYIGINTPELSTTKNVQCFGLEAKEKNKELVEGKTIQMKKDVSEVDKYKRLLRYVWVPSTSSPLRLSSEGQVGQDVFVNEYLVREGYALQATYPPDIAYVVLFRTAAKEAQLNNKGLWRVCK